MEHLIDTIVIAIFMKIWQSTLSAPSLYGKGLFYTFHRYVGRKLFYKRTLLKLWYCVNCQSVWVSCLYYVLYRFLYQKEPFNIGLLCFYIAFTFLWMLIVPNHVNLKEPSPDSDTTLPH